MRQRLELNMTEFGHRIGVTHASVSQYESGKIQPSQSVLMLLSELAETDEERSCLSSAIGGEEDDVGEENVIREIRKASGMNKGLFAVRVGASPRDVEAWETGTDVPAPSIVDKLKAIAAECGRGDLALTLSSEEWTVRAVFHPGEKFISQYGKESPVEATRRERLHQLLDKVLATGQADVIGHVESALDMADRLTVPAKPATRKKAG